MLKTIRGVPLQAFCPDPNKSQEPITMAAGATVTLAKSSLADVNISDWNIVKIFTTGQLFRHFNQDSNKQHPVLDEVIIIIHSDVDGITLINPSADTSAIVYIEGA
jgi:hypothetical protein